MMNVTLIRGDARRLPLADGSVQCVVTSPPYFGLRDYGVSGQIGLEPSIEAYVATMVQVFREVKRVLRDDGCIFVNMGDAYAHNGACGGSLPDGPRKARETDRAKQLAMNYRAPDGIAPKNLLGIPWRIAFALQADGWVLRADIVWSKPNPMPESVTDRPTKSHEYVFLLAKRERYYYDSNAVREDGPTYHRKAGGYIGRDGNNASRFGGKGGFGDSDVTTTGRNARSVWTITPRPFAGAHFATFPAELVRRCIAAGTSERGQCPHCGTAWRRITSTESRQGQPMWSGAGRQNGCPAGGGHAGRTGQWSSETSTLGWRPCCTCPPHEPVPQVVLDCFGGAGTVPLVASNMGRRGVMVELSAKYVAMARRRISRPHAKPERPERDEQHPLFAGLDV